MTSEPVGNRPRSEPSGNSHKAREAAAAKPAAEERDPIAKVVVGKVVTVKPPWYKRFVRNMIAEDASDVGDFLLADVIYPALRNLVRDVAVGGIDRTLYGSTRPRANRSTIVGGVSSIRSKYHDLPTERSRSLSRDERARHDFDSIVLESRGEAVDVIEGLILCIDKYGSATVSNLYNLLGITGSYTDISWGWTDLRDADVRPARDGFRLDLPAPQPIR